MNTKSNRPAAGNRNVLWAVLYTLIAIMTGVVAVIAAVEEDQIVMLVFGVPALLSGRMAMRHWKPRYAVEDLAELDASAPVVFLRPFAEDGDWDGAAPFAVWDPRTWRKFPLSPSNLTTLYLELSGRTSFEQVVAWVTRKKGPMVAIGEPGGAPVLGAHNIYIGDDGWQEAVQGLLDRASLVVMTAGTSKSVIWEFAQVVDRVSPERVLLCIPGQSRTERADLFEAFRAALPADQAALLPETPYLGRFAVFGSDWSPMEHLRRPKKLSTPAFANRIAQIVA
ncbi:MAG: hypothetical protein AAGA26_04635 [Pseudomonadota bacterium]